MLRRGSPSHMPAALPWVPPPAAEVQPGARPAGLRGGGAGGPQRPPLRELLPDARGPGPPWDGYWVTLGLCQRSGLAALRAGLPWTSLRSVRTSRGSKPARLSKCSTRKLRPCLSPLAWVCRPTGIPLRHHLVTLLLFPPGATVSFQVSSNPQILPKSS